MALLFLKKKLFPAPEPNQIHSKFHHCADCASSFCGNVPVPCSDIVTLTSLVFSLLLGKPLLGHIDDEDTIHGDSDPDLESQRSYDTFGRCVSQDGSTGSGSQRSRINPRIISDAILGLSDGLTVPFALSAGLSALGNTKVVVLGGLAELAAGAISMGLGGYVGAKSEA